MAVYTVTNRRRVNNVVALQLLTDPDINVGDTVTVSGTGATWTGTVTVISREGYYLQEVNDSGYLVFDTTIPKVNQICFELAGTDTDGYETSDGTVSIAHTVTWADDDDVIQWLGIDPTSSNDLAFVTTATKAANAWAYRKRREAGYTDAVASAPSDDVKLGTILYAAVQYRSRGAVDSFASFDNFGGVTAPTMSLGQIYALLGIGRPQVG